MNHFHVCKKIKSFFLITLSSVILACSIPSFSIKSQALEVAGYGLAYEMLLTFSTYMASKGYSILRTSSSDSPTTTIDWRYAPLELANDTLKSIGDALDTAFPGASYGAQLLRALNVTIQTGRLRLSQDLRNAIDEYFGNNTANGTMNFGQIEYPLDDLAFTTNDSYWITNINPDNYRTLYNNNYPTIPVAVTIGDSDYIFLMPIRTIFDDPSSLETYGNEYMIRIVNNRASGDFAYTYKNQTFRIQYLSTWGGTQISNNFTSFYAGAYTAGSSIAAIAGNIIRQYLAGTLNMVYQNLTADQVTDTSNTDVLTSTNTVDANGNVIGDSTYYMLNAETLQSLLDSYSTGAISYRDLINALGLATVASDATVSEKENAIADALVPDATYQWFTSTLWGSDTIARTATEGMEQVDTQEKAKTSAIGQLFKRYAGGEEPDQEDLDKAGTGFILAMLYYFLSEWEFPSVDPDDADGGGTDDESDPGAAARAADVIAGVGVASSLLGDIFDAAGGSSGYGMIFTIGMSFVLFSVIIGAGHFLGGLGNHAEVQSKSSSAPDKPAASSKNVARSGQHRHARIAEKKGA